MAEHQSTQWTGYDAILASRHQWALAGRIDGSGWYAEAVVPIRDASQGTAWQAVADGLRHGDDVAIKAVSLLASHSPHEFRRMVKECPGFRL